MKSPQLRVRETPSLVGVPTDARPVWVNISSNPDNAQRLRYAARV